MRIATLIVLATVAVIVPGEQRLERVASTADDIEIGSIASLAVSKQGEIFVADGKLQHIVVYDTAGHRSRTIGRKGEGPLEFRALSKLAWLADTLVAYDAYRRVTFISPSGKLIRSLPWPAGEAPDIWLGPGGSTLLVVAYGQGRTEPIAGIKGTRWVRPPKTFLQIQDTTATRLTWPADPTVDSLGRDCWTDPAGWVWGLSEIPGGNGPFNAVTPRGDFVFLSPDHTRVLIQTPAQRARPIGKSYAPVRVTDQLWNREAAPYVALEKKHGKLTCSRPFLRPATLPAIRAIAADELGRLWVEVNSADGDGYFYDVYDPTGKFLITLGGHKRRVQTIPFVVRGDKLYAAEKDEDDVASITVYRWVH